MENKEGAQPEEVRKERRRFKRINKSFIVSYAPITTEITKYDVSQTKDLSEGGLLFVSDRKFGKDVVLKMKLRFPEFPDYVIVLAQVVDSVERAKGIIYETRAKFIDVEPKVVDVIKRLVERG